MASSGSPEVAASGAAAMAGSGSPALAASGSPAGDAGKMVKLPDGLQYEDQAVGTGPEAKAGDTVTVNYVGTLTNGTKFDASADHGTPFSFPLGQHKVIAGWDEGVAGMKKGGKRHLVIPPSLGYGPQAMGDKIPANSTLVFDVELVSISPK
jgi:FKBP-type peptidyl-prolyl cis-trans isomerase